MRELLDDIRRWREEGEDVVIATVVGTRRSAPRPVGSSFAVSSSGALCGSVSGGCVESAIAQEAEEVFATGSRSSSPTASPTTRAGTSACPAAARSTCSWRKWSEPPRPPGRRPGTGRSRGAVHRRRGRGRGRQVPHRGGRDRRRVRRAGRRGHPRRAQHAARDRRPEGLRRGLHAAAAAVRLRRRRHRRGALPRGQEPRLDDDRRRRAARVRDPRALPERRRADRRVAEGGARPRRPRPPDRDHRAHPRREVRPARARGGARDRGLLHRRARLAPQPGEAPRAPARGRRAGGVARPHRRPLRPRHRRGEPGGDGALDPRRDPRRARRPLRRLPARGQAPDPRAGGCSAPSPAG